MTAHDPKALPRVVVRYHTAYAAHKFVFHVLAPLDAATAGADAAAVASTLRPALCTTGAFDGADFIVAGTNVANPATGFVAVAGSSGAPDLIDAAATSITWTGRTVAGTRCKLVFFTTLWRPDSNFRFTGAEIPALQTIWTWLNTGSSPIVAADGLVPVWRQGVTLNVNRHWLRTRRRL